MFVAEFQRLRFGGVELPSAVRFDFADQVGLEPVGPSFGEIYTQRRAV
jgi:hypothetical protein